MHSDNVHCLSLLLFVAAYCAVYFCCRTPSSFTICCQMLHSLLFVGATCHTVAIGFIPFVATCCTVYYSLPCSVQLLLVLHTVQFTSVAALRTVQYSLPHAMQFAICCCMCHTVCYWWPCAIQLLLVLHTVQVTSFATLHTVQYSLLHAMQFAICCYKCHTVCYLLLQVPYSLLYSLLFVAMCRIVAIGAAYREVDLLPHSVQFNIRCYMPCSLLFVVACAIQFAIQFTVRCHVPYSCYWCYIP